MNAIQPHTSVSNNGREHPRPLVMIALAFMTGIVYAKFFPVSLSAVTVLLMLLVSVWFSWIKNHAHTSAQSTQSIHGMMILILAGVFGAVRMETQLSAWKTAANEVQQAARMGPQTLTGTLIEKGFSGSVGYAVLDDVTAEKWLRVKSLPGKVELRAPVAVMQDLRTGARISFEAQLVPIRGPSIPTAFNYQEFRHSQSIYAGVYLRSGTPITVHSPHRFNPVLQIRDLAAQSVQLIRNKLPDFTPNSEDTTALIASICFGIRDLTSEPLRNRLQESGLAHITSISGLHVTMVLYLLFSLLNQAGIKRKPDAWIVLLASIGYLCLVGFRIPAIRSVLMAFVLMGQHIFQRKPDSMNSLGLAALLILFMNPNELFLASFQLSFAAVLILLLYSPLDRRIAAKVQWLPIQWLLRGMASSTAVVTGLAPFTVHYFHMLSWGSIFGNLIAVPIVSLLLPVSYLWSLSFLLPSYPPFSWIAAMPGYASSALAEALLEVLRWFSAPFFWWVLPGWNIYVSALLLVCMLLLIQPRKVFFQWASFRIYSYQMAFILLITFIFARGMIQSNMPLRVDFLSLGQGDCILVRSPAGGVMLMDGGSPVYKKSDKGFSRLEDYLLSQGIHAIHAIVLSHPQADHIGDLANIARRFQVGRFFEGTEDFSSKSYTELRVALHEKKIPIQKARKGGSFRLDAQTVCWVLHPQTTEWDRKGDINEQSVVILMESMGLRFLFTGDIGTATENSLCRMYTDWETAILKVPHHGSRYSSGKTFLQALQPEISVIQVGRNHYGHPHPDTRQRLYDAQAHVLRNDYDGTVSFMSFGSSFRIHTTRANRLYLKLTDGDAPDSAHR